MNLNLYFIYRILLNVRALINSIRTGLLLILIFKGFLVQAQYAISYPQPAQDVEACQLVGRLFVRLDFVSSSDNTLISIDLPDGLSYVAGSLLRTGGVGLPLLAS